MMPMKSSKFIYPGIALGLLLLVPVFVMAAEDSNTPWTKRAQEAKERVEARQAQIEERANEREAKREEREADREKKFCTRFTEIVEKMSNRMEERGSKIKENVSNRETNMDEKREERDNKLDGNRDEQDARRAKLYAELEARADTDAEKAAVVTFKETMDDLVKTRRAAVDAAITAFRSGVDASIATKKDGASSAYTDFKAAMDAAVAKAKSTCESGTDPDTVRDTFKSDMESAREALKGDRSELEKVGEKVKALAEVRKTAVEKALTEFKAGAEAARATLKAAFGETVE